MPTEGNAVGEQPFAILKHTWVPIIGAICQRFNPFHRALSSSGVRNSARRVGKIGGLHCSFPLRFPLERPPIGIILFRPSASPERIPCLGSGTYGRRRLPRNRRVRLFSPPATTPRDKSRGTPDTRAPRGRYAAKKPFAPVLRSAAALWVQGRRTRPKRSAIAGDGPRREQHGDKTMPAIGLVTKLNNGGFKGQIKTLSIRADIDIVPNNSKAAETQPDFRVLTQGVEIGAGWIRKGEASGKDYVSLSLAAPEFGPRKLYANLGRAAGQDDEDVFAVIWNPAD